MKLGHSPIARGIIAGSVVAAGITLGAAVPASAVVPDCLGLNESSAGTTQCVAPGILGSGGYVSMSVIVDGASGGGGYNGGYSTGGSGARLTANISVPTGTTLDLYVGGGGLATDNADSRDGAGGGGSSAITISGSSLLLLESGGGGGGTNLEDWDGGNASASNGAGEAGINSGVCGGRGGNTDGLGTGGAAGSTTGSAGGVDCAGSASVAAGTAGGNAPVGNGGNGGSDIGLSVNSGGGGYHEGGDGGKVNGPVYGGSGGGGGYGGGGGGAGSLATLDSDDGATGTGGGGGSYLNPLYASGTFGTANNGEYEDDGDPGEITFASAAGATVLTQQAIPSDVTPSAATLHSMVNPGAVTDSTPSIRYSKSSSMASGVQTATVSPTSITVSSGDTNVTGTVASGLEACTTYYYQAVAVGEGDPAPTTYGAIESFTTTGCSTQLPLTVNAKSAGAKLKRSGKSVVISSASTSDLGKVTTTVKCARAANTRGDLRYCTYTVGKKGKVTVKTYGYARVKVTVTQRAVPKTGANATASSKWKRTWSVK